MTLDEMIQKKRQLGYTNEQIANKSGVPLGTVQKIFGRFTSSPRHETLLALEKAFADEALVCEDVLIYKAKKESKTIEDYYSLPKDKRVELIDGQFFVMEAPSILHQEILLEIAFQIKSYIKANHGHCKVFTAPIDVQLDKDEKTMLQPDVIVCCNEELWSNGKNIFGAPELVIEVLSPTTLRKDFSIKYSKYKMAGVKEYWMVDPDFQKIYVSDFSQENILFKIYNFGDNIPVLIYDGKLELNLSVYSSGN